MRCSRCDKANETNKKISRSMHGVDSAPLKEPLSVMNSARHRNARARRSIAFAGVAIEPSMPESSAKSSLLPCKDKPSCVREQRASRAGSGVE